MNGKKQQKISFAEYELDPLHRMLRRAGNPLALNAKTFDLLAFLLERNGQIVTKNEILDAVWEGQFVEEANLSVQVSALRKILCEKKNEPRFLITVPGKGYKFVAEIKDSAVLEEEIIIEKHRVSRLLIEENVFEDKLEEKDVYQDKSEKKLENKKTNKVAGKPRMTLVHWLSVSFAVLLLLFAGGYWFSGGFRGSDRAGGVPVSAAERQNEVRRLTNSGRVTLAVLSPDGRFYAYSHSEIGRFRTELRVGQTDGSSDLALLAPADTIYNPIAFSADGSALYYFQTAPRQSVGTLYKIPVLGGVSQKILSGIHSSLAISPDERQIAFIRSDQTQKKSAIILMNIDGTHERELAARPSNQPFSNLSLAWSPDAAQIAFAAQTEANGSFEVFAADTKNGNVTAVTALRWIEVARLAWLKDMSGLLAVARAKDMGRMTQIWKIERASGNASRIVRDLSKYGSVLSLSADSRAFLAAQVNAESNIWIAPAGNLKEAKQITFGTLGRQDGWYGLDWTPDGQLVYTAQNNQSLTLWTMDAAGGNNRQITPLGFRDKMPSAAADGKTIVFESDRSGANEIWRVTIDGSDLRQLTDTGGNSNPTTTPDGEWLIYRHTDGAEGAIWRVPLAGGTAEQLTFRNSFAPRVSPDGKFFACGYAHDSKIKLAVFNLTGGEPVKLFDVPVTYNFDLGSLRWTADGKSLAYRDWANGIWTQDLSGGAPELLADLPKEKFYPFAWSPDGKQFVFTRGREVRDAILITDFQR